MSNKKFWNNKVRKCGHTGWTDNFIYAYDQQARLIAIEKILNSLNFKKEVALDFGTGSGDFANLLSKYFKKVVAFDSSDAVIKVAKQRYKKAKNIRFFHENNIEKIGISNSTVDIILSVTVLDHIMSDSELVKVLKHLREILRENGIIIALEYALDYKKSKTAHQRFMKLEEWRSRFLNCGFYLHKYYGFYHPVESPCESYLSYRSHIRGLKGKILRLFIKHVSYELVNKYLNKLANESIQGKNDLFWEDTQKKSPIKIMMFKKLI